LVLFVFFTFVDVNAQSLPLGLYEGFLGNSGVAISDSKAPSVYNPSLLSSKPDSSFSIGGNSIVNNSTNSESLSGSKNFVTPGYLSSIINGEDLVHEFFLYNQSSFQINSKVTNDSLNSDLNLDLVRYFSGYTMAFKSIPFAMQFFGIYEEANFSYIAENKNNNQLIAILNSKSSNKKFNASLGLSGGFKSDIYSFGANFQVSPLKIYENKSGLTNVFTASNNNLSKQELSGSNTTISSIGHTLRIGHGFLINSHEFLFDTNFYEADKDSRSYAVYQTFGYRFLGNDKHQLLCGISQAIAPTSKKIGNDTYLSTGYSWSRGKSRSSVGLFYYNLDESSKYQTYGVNFSSEYGY
jgi:hypothetical protein